MVAVAVAVAVAGVAVTGIAVAVAVAVGYCFWSINFSWIHWCQPIIDHAVVVVVDTSTHHTIAVYVFFWLFMKGHQIGAITNEKQYTRYLFYEVLSVITLLLLLSLLLFLL